MATTKKAGTTPKATTKKADPSQVLAGIRERNAADGFDTTGAMLEIMDAEQAATSATAVLGDRLAESPRIAAEVFGVRGAQAALATAMTGQKAGKAKNAAEQAIGRVVKCGRVLAAHPSLDALTVYTTTNRLNSEQVDEIVAAKDGAAALTKAAAGTKAKAAAGAKAGTRGAGKKAGSEKERTLREQVVAASKENAAAIKKAEALTGEDPATVADDLALLISSLESTLKAAKVIHGGAVAEKARRSEKAVPLDA